MGLVRVAKGLREAYYTSGVGGEEGDGVVEGARSIGEELGAALGLGSSPDGRLVRGSEAVKGRSPLDELRIH